MSAPFKNKSMLLGISFVMILSSVVLISQFGVGDGNMSASAVVQQNTQHQVNTRLDTLGSIYRAIGNVAVGATNASLQGYVTGIRAWVNMMPQIASTGTQTALAVGGSLEKMVGTTAVVIPAVYLKGIYAVGNGVAYIGIKGATVNSLADAGLSNLFTGNSR